MQLFSGMDYLRIAVANAYGLDGQNWQDRIDWTNNNSAILDGLAEQAKEPMLYRKALLAYEDAQKGHATGYIMGLDATASGIQIMACLSGCRKSAENANLGDLTDRQNVYQNVTDRMNTGLSTPVFDISQIKKPVMTTCYGSKAQPKQVFGEDTEELALFYDTLDVVIPGCIQTLAVIQSCWQPTAIEHSWTMPDGHAVVVPVTVETECKIEIDELDHATFTHRGTLVAPQQKGISLAANVVHSVDAYIAREMSRRADSQNFSLLLIHDSFWASPIYMDRVRSNYLDIMMEICDMPLLQNILREVSGNRFLSVNKLSSDLKLQVSHANYAIC